LYRKTNLMAGCTWQAWFHIFGQLIPSFSPSSPKRQEIVTNPPTGMKNLNRCSQPTNWRWLTTFIMMRS
jgi:hypothetical protein